MNKKTILLLALFSLLISCGDNRSKKNESASGTETNVVFLEQERSADEKPAERIADSHTIARFKEYGLVNIKDYSTDILVDLKYATTDNFTGVVAYEDFTEAWMIKDVAIRLARVQVYLSELYPGYRLLVYDAARPISVQQKFFDIVKGTSQEQYVSNPRNTGLHNYGVAIDLTIVDTEGIPLDMGCGFDYFGKAAHTNIETQLLAEGLLTQAHIDNRKLLRKVMEKEHFRVLPNEWWHFNACTLKEAKAKYPLLNF